MCNKIIWKHSKPYTILWKHICPPELLNAQEACYFCDTLKKNSKKDANFHKSKFRNLMYRNHYLMHKSGLLNFDLLKNFAMTCWLIRLQSNSKKEEN